MRKLLFAAILAAALLPRLYHVRSPYMNFADHNTSMHAIFARNYVERGLIATRLGQVRDLGEAAPEDYSFFAHHPPAIALLTAGSFLVFGPSETASRVLPILASAASALLLLALGRRIFGKGWGVLPGLLFALFPGAIYFGRMLAHESFVVLGGLVCILTWCRHAETGDRRWWRACLAALAATILVDWPGAYLVPALAAASACAPATRPRWKRMSLQAAAVAGATLLLVLAHIRLLMGSFADLREALSTRVLSSGDLTFTWAEYLGGIRESLRHALTLQGGWLAAFGAALVVVALLRRWVQDRNLRVRDGGRAASRSDGARRDEAAAARPAAVALALAIFGGLHHAIFSNACHFNPHVVYYLLPSFALLLTAGPCLAHRGLRALLPRRAAAASILLVLALPSWSMARAAVGETWAYFNVESIPGWPLLGKSLNDIVPQDGILVSTTGMTYPQFLYSLWRARYDHVTNPEWITDPFEDSYLLRDLNQEIPEETERALSSLPATEILSFNLHDLTGRGLPPSPPFHRAEEPPWEIVDADFGDALRLTLARFSPPVVRSGPDGALPRYLGVPWTPARAAARTVHASFSWERMEGEAPLLVPDYQLVTQREGDPVRAPTMWWVAGSTLDLAGLEPGRTARHEIDWFMAEWLPPGDYRLQVRVLREGRPLPVVGGDGEAEPGAALTIGIVRFGEEEVSPTSAGAADREDRE